MTFSSGAVVNTVAFGNRPENVEIPVVSQVNPASTDVNYPVGKRWINSASNVEWVLTSFSSVSGITSATWTLLEAASSALNTINSQAPIAGNFNMVGTAQQITVTPSAGQDVFSVPSTFVAPGSITATAGNITATNGNLVLGTAGNKLSIATGLNASVGISVAMIGGTTMVSTSAVTSSSIILLSVDTPGGTQGILSVGTIVNGVSFVINSSDASDTSTVSWLIIN